MKRKMIRIALALITGVLVSACGDGQSKKAEQRIVETETAVSEMHTSEISLDYAGMYEGTLPAADGPGIKTQLSLNKDKTFKLISEYIGKKNAVFTDSGSYMIQKDIVTLDMKEDRPVYYKLEEGRVVRLDGEKRVVTGPLAEHYILKQTNTY